MVTEVRGEVVYFGSLRRSCDSGWIRGEKMSINHDANIHLLSVRISLKWRHSYHQCCSRAEIVSFDDVLEWILQWNCFSIDNVDQRLQTKRWAYHILIFLSRQLSSRRLAFTIDNEPMKQQLIDIYFTILCSICCDLGSLLRPALGISWGTWMVCRVDILLSQ